LYTQNTKNDTIPSNKEDQSKAIEGKKLEHPHQEIGAEPEITTEQLSIGKCLLSWRTIVPLVVAIVVLVFFTQRANINPQKTWNAIRTANNIFLLAAFLIYYLAFPIRALRWRILLGNVGFAKANGMHLPKFGKLVEIIYISWFANAIVPAKLGDLYRAYLLRQDTGSSASRSFGTVLAERLLDLIVLLLLFIPAAIISLHENLPPQLLLGLKVTLVGVIIGIMGLFVWHLLREHVTALVPPRFRNHYNHFQEGTLGSFRRLPTLTGLTVSVWACESLRFFFIALSLNLIGGNLVHIVTAAFFIALGEALLTVVPFTGGGVGVVEGGMVAMLLLFTHGTPNAMNLSAAAIVLDRMITLFSILAIGFIVFIFAFSRQATRQHMAGARPARGLQPLSNSGMEKGSDAN
jgi:glycosyltransferase 2 family protein